MKKIVLVLITCCVAFFCRAQNIGIGTSNPLNKLQVQGSLLVTEPNTATSTAPTAAQTKTMPGLGTLAFMLDTDSTGRLYDSGGPAGNYGIDHDGKATIAASINDAIELTVETMDINIGDSLIIKESATGATLFAIAGRYTTTGKMMFNSSSLYIQFKSNTDFNIGAGFSLLFKRVYTLGNNLPNLSGYTGRSFFYDVKNGALRSGLLGNGSIGQYSAAIGYRAIASGLYSIALGTSTTASGGLSTAMGHLTTASGHASTSMGLYSVASGFYSTAMGNYSIASGQNSLATGSAATASGENSTAMGFLTRASGDASTAMGASTDAFGNYSTAMGKFTNATGYAATSIGDSSNAGGTASLATGFRTTASGDYSTALGSYVSTNNHDGSFVIGDASTTTTMNAANANNFRARFAGGYKLFTSANLATGCTLFAGDNAWTTGSDVRTKENFANVDGEDFLKKIAAMQLTSWNYKTQNSKTFRHYGPMAQDFFAAFGTDKYGTIGNDTSINSADFAGVSFIAIQALEKRTQAIEDLKKENASQADRLERLKKENDALKEMFLQLRKEMDDWKKANNKNL